MLNQSEFENLITQKLINLGENPQREGLLKTPERVYKSYQFLTSGYHVNIQDIINGALFEENTQDMVIVNNIEMYSLCEHHMLPFFGKVHVAYLPNKKIIGISKIPRLVDLFSRRLQVQERLTHEIAESLQEVLKPKGVAVVIEAQHFCMMMRGVQKQNSSLTTSSMLGEFRKSQSTRMEFLNLLS